LTLYPDLDSGLAESSISSVLSQAPLDKKEEVAQALQAQELENKEQEDAELMAAISKMKEVQPIIFKHLWRSLKLGIPLDDFIYGAGEVKCAGLQLKVQALQEAKQKISEGAAVQARRHQEAAAKKLAADEEAKRVALEEKQRKVDTKKQARRQKAETDAAAASQPGSLLVFQSDNTASAHAPEEKQSKLRSLMKSVAQVLDQKKEEYARVVSLLANLVVQSKERKALVQFYESRSSALPPAFMRKSEQLNSAIEECQSYKRVFESGKDVSSEKENKQNLDATFLFLSHTLNGLRGLTAPRRVYDAHFNEDTLTLA
jgi:hypothetical protein